jgi:hypothetical protein
MFSISFLSHFVRCLKKVRDPRSKQRQPHPFSTILAIIFLGPIGNITTLAEIQRWTKLHFTQLKKFLHFAYKDKKQQIPHAISLARVLRKLSLADLQQAFVDFLNVTLNDTSLIAAVDGKTAKQMKNEKGNPLHLLNVFAQVLKVHLASWSVNGNKTNESGCLKKHLEEFFTMYPCLKLLTGDAIFAQRPLLEALQEYHCDYLFQAKDRFYNEDKHVCGSDWGQAFSVLTNMVLSFVQLLRKRERTLREVRKNAKQNRVLPLENSE